ncbi:MAG: KpsF/GutQ family sugar-phosphate isomerase [Pseudomonadota bacterium]
MPQQDHIAVAREVIGTELKGLDALAAAIDGRFTEAVETLKAVKGRVVVTGMGKSGHVARKIAATLASTGKPASFVHPGEASHGDLGMIARNDAVIAISKSGEAAELRDLLAYAKRFAIPLIAITGGPASTLGKAADIVLLLPEAEEACGETRAPTTSTTMTMALGDALAVALLQDAGFSADDFHVYHPGGKLGASLLKVRDMMHGADALPLCPLNAPMKDAVAVMSVRKFGCIGVTDADGKLAGIITDGDLRRHFGEDFSTRTAKDLMTPAPKTVRPDTIAGEALAILSEKKITALFVVEDGRPVGLLHVHDCLSTGVV